MGDAVDKLDLSGGLKDLAGQVNRVKSNKTSKMNLLAKAIRRFEDDTMSDVLWHNFTACKIKCDDYCEAYTILLDAIVSSIDKELATDEKGPADPLHARRETIINNLDSFDQEKEQIDGRYFELATSVSARKNAVPVPDGRVNPCRVQPVDTIRPACASLKLMPSEFQV